MCFCTYMIDGIYAYVYLYHIYKMYISTHNVHNIFFRKRIEFFTGNWIGPTEAQVSAMNPFRCVKGSSYFGLLLRGSQKEGMVEVWGVRNVLNHTLFWLFFHSEILSLELSVSVCFETRIATLREKLL